ncbi:hypothetical protein HMPREF3202_01517 [Prevotella bivia]|uniref:Uncharacterized protein n=1 Tax=Prevotella bivia TaxID=28125 RepID=A0A137STZ3_9BACT|nr:hypothetical protein HMPREF3202_01517 [Prevotella bivia]
MERQYANHSQRQRRDSHDRERARWFLRCNVAKAQLSIATSTKSLSPATRRKGYRGAGSLRERTAARSCLALSTHYHHRFVLSIGQHGSPLVQETYLARVTTPHTYGRTDIPIRKWQYQLIHFFLSPILSYYITTRRDNTVKEKGLALCSQKGEIAITTTNYSLQLLHRKARRCLFYISNYLYIFAI